MKIKTKSGFTWDIDVDKLKKHKALKLSAASQKGDIAASEDLLNYILGEAGEEALDAHCAKMSDDGEADAEDVFNEFAELLTKIAEGKNS